MLRREISLLLAIPRAQGTFTAVNSFVRRWSDARMHRIPFPVATSSSPGLSTVAYSALEYVYQGTSLHRALALRFSSLVALACLHSSFGFLCHDISSRGSVPRGFRVGHCCYAIQLRQSFFYSPCTSVLFSPRHNCV